MLAINTKLKEYDDILNIATQYDNVYGSVGIHPHQAEEEPNVELSELLKRSEHEKIVGIGETGLDYFYDTAPRDLQRNNFRTHLTASAQTNLPVIIHTRDADDDCISIMQEMTKDKAFPGLIHCFTATQELADASLDLGLYISISGIVTFKNAADLREVVKTVPLDRLLIETDAPFLAPIPHRGKTCEPAYVSDTCRYLAEMYGVSAEELREITSHNFFTLFSKAKAPEAWSRDQ